MESEIRIQVDLQNLKIQNLLLNWFLVFQYQIQLLIAMPKKGLDLISSKKILFDPISLIKPFYLFGEIRKSRDSGQHAPAPPFPRTRSRLVVTGLSQSSNVSLGRV